MKSMKDKICFYKICDTTTGLYSTGGEDPKFNKRGKTWNNIGHVKAHLIGYKRAHEHDNIGIPRTWQVEEFVFEKCSSRIIPLEEIVLAAGMF